MFKNDIKLIPSLMDEKYSDLKKEINDAIARKVANRIKDKKKQFLEKARSKRSGG